MCQDSQIKSETQDAEDVETPKIYEKLRVRINYLVDNWRDGVHWVGGGDDLRYPHCFTTQSSVPGSTCSWVPCVEDPEEKYPWELEFTLPAKLKSITNIDEDDSADDQAELDDEASDHIKHGHDMMVVCCGDFIDEVCVASVCITHLSN